MLSALIGTEHSYPTLLLAKQLVDQRFVHPSPLVLRTTPLKLQRPHQIRTNLSHAYSLRSRRDANIWMACEWCERKRSSRITASMDYTTNQQFVLEFLISKFKLVDQRIIPFLSRNPATSRPSLYGPSSFSQKTTSIKNSPVLFLNFFTVRNFLERARFPRCYPCPRLIRHWGFPDMSWFCN